MGKTTSKHIGMLIKAFIKVRFDGQTDPSTLSKKMNEDKKQPLAVLIDTETCCDSMQKALNAAIATDPSYKNGAITIEHKGGSVIPVFLLRFKETKLAFRLLPDGPYISAYKALQEGATKEHLPQQHLITEFKYVNTTYHLELMECCDKGSIEQQAMNHSELIKNKQQRLLKYSMNILQILIDFRKEGYVFPDIKPSNFLVTHDDRVVISDVKTLLDIRGKESLPKDDVQNTPMYESGSGLVRVSQGMSLGGGLGSVRNKMISIDEIELKSRYMVGVTLYELATGHQVAKELVKRQQASSLAFDEAKNHYEQTLRNGTDAEKTQAKTERDKKETDYLEIVKVRPHDEMDWTHEVFKRGVGLELKKIIHSLTNKDRNKRMSFDDARGVLLAAFPDAPSLLKARRNSDGDSVVAPSPSTSTGDNSHTTSSSPVTVDDEPQSPITKKRGFFRRNRTASSSVVAPLKKDATSKALLSELSTEISSRQPSSKKQPHHAELDIVTEEELSSPRLKLAEEKKSGLIQRERTASSSAVVVPKKKKKAIDKALLSELSTEIASRQSPSKKQQRFNTELEVLAEEESSSPRERKGTADSEEEKRKTFRRARTASSPAVVDPKIKKSEENKSSEALLKFSVFQESSSPRKSSKVSVSPLSPRDNKATSSAELAGSSPSDKTKEKEGESSPNAFFKGPKSTSESVILDEPKSVIKEQGASSSATTPCQ